MSFSDIKRNTAVKAAAVFITVISMVCAVCFSVIWMFGDACGYDSDEGFFSTGHCRDMCTQYVWSAQDSFFLYKDNKLVFNDISDSVYFGEEYSNVGLEVYKTEDTDGEVKKELLGSTFVPENAALIGEIPAGDEYIVKYYLAEPLTAADGFYRAEKNYEFINPMMGWLLPAAAVSLIITAACLAFLMCAAGYRRGCEGVTANVQDRIPYDLHLCLTGGIVVGALVMSVLLLEEASYSTGYSYLDAFDPGFIYLAVLMVFAAAGAATAFILTSASRFKLGGWWKNTLIYIFLGYAWRLTKYTWHIFKKYIWGTAVKAVKAAGGGITAAVKALPLIWKTVGASAVMLFLIVVLAGIGEAETVLIAIFLSIITLGAVVYFSICMRILQKGGRELAAGNEDFRIDTGKMVLDFREHGENLNSIGKGMKIAVDQRMKSERLKTELITNVSHDLKTPLTSIINYVDLLGREELEEPAAEYVEVLSRQALRLKKLTEDVVEASKASTGNITVNLTNTDAFEIISQAAGEYREKLESSSLELIIKNETARESIFINADGRLLWRAIDNLMGNACKYSQPGTRVYVNIREEDGEAVVQLKNISREELNISADELMERFVRGDSSRSSEGSGLGLNIAKSLVEIQGGKLSVSIDGDLFKAEIRFKLN
ncbi:MAG: HAMP domain-containing sensor histidine kinase [Bacillota bacterium]|nr:HAMP domain-containing sensor histidine kinase [Bacillota bacterium]